MKASKAVGSLIGLGLFVGFALLVADGSRIDAENKRQRQERYITSIYESGNLAGRAGAPAESNPWSGASGFALGDKTAESATWLKGWSEGTIEREKQ